MIEVTYHRQFHRVKVEGHAYSGEEGHDLVCAACSALTHTVAANVENWCGAGRAGEHGITLGKGYAEISCKPRNDYRALLTLVLDGICAGFELLARDYPEFIRYNRRG